MPKVPTVTKITIERIVDEDPDLSYLQQDYLEDSISGTERTKYIEQDKSRLDSYGNSWIMLGIRAKAEYLIPENNGQSAIIQYLQSGGLYGIESDSGEEYLQSIEKEEIESLKGYCKKMKILVPDNMEIVKKE